LNLKAQTWRLQGVASASVGDATTQYFERSIRTLATVGDACGRADAIEDYTAASWKALGNEPVVHGPLDSPLDGITRKPRRITYHPDQASSLLPETALTPAQAIDAIASLRELASHPEALGQEAFELLLRTDCTSQMALVARRESGAEQVLAIHGAPYEAKGRLPKSLRDGTKMPLGKAQARDLEIVAQPRPHLQAQMTLIAVAKILADALALEKAQREERERAAIWPLDALVEAEHGVFAAANMMELAALARRIAASPVTVLITGETGTGKEVLARLVHAHSPRASGVFIPFNCGSVPKDMLDSQLFGHRRGAFTGALENFPGVIRAAAGGTLFLDEIAELSPDVQPKLLRFLDSKEIHPLGEPKPVTVDVRIVAATNARLEQAVSEGRFREDLFYRLNVMRLAVPPLRERREEIPLLVEHFLSRACTELRKSNVRLSEETMEYLLLYKWPGNVRQLSSEISRLVALAESGAVIMPEHLKAEITAGRRTVPASSRALTPHEVVVRTDQPLTAATEHLERAMIQQALASSKNRNDKAAKLLGLSRKGLYLKRQRLKI
jgi:transcriptional regulator with PAS, ATPase and Fis domain